MIITTFYVLKLYPTSGKLPEDLSYIWGAKRLIGRLLFNTPNTTDR